MRVALAPALAVSVLGAERAFWMEGPCLGREYQVWHLHQGHGTRPLGGPGGGQVASADTTAESTRL